MRHRIGKELLFKGLVLLVVSVLAGCGSSSVANDVSQSQANEIVSVLNENGITSEASRETGGRGRYSVSVKRGFYVQAVSILHERGLPGEPEPTFAETIASKGLLPNSREIESLRVDRALAIELEEMLRTHPRIANAKVVVRLNFLKDNSTPGVSVVIQERPGQAIDHAEVASIVTRAVPGIQQESIFISSAPPVSNVTVKSNEGIQNVDGKVIRVPLEPFLGIWRIPEDDLTGLSLTLLAVLLVIGVVGGFVGYWYGYFQQSKRYFEANLPEVTSRPLRIDRGRKDQSEL